MQPCIRIYVQRADGAWTESKSQNHNELVFRRNKKGQNSGILVALLQFQVDTKGLLECCHGRPRPYAFPVFTILFTNRQLGDRIPHVYS